MALTQKSIQSNDLGIVISNLVVRNLYANTSTPVAEKGIGVVNANYEGDASRVASVGVTKIPRNNLVRRVLGTVGTGNLNGNGGVFMTTNETLELSLLNRIDPIYELPQAQQGMLNYSVAEQIAYNISGFVSETVDKDTLNEIYVKAVAFGATLTVPYSNIITADLTTQGEGFTALLSAFNYLTNLPTNNYDTSAPIKGRCQVVTETLYQDYISTKGIVVAGSDLGLKTLVNGIEGYTEDELIENSAYRGRIFGVNTFVAPDAFMPVAVAGDVYGIVTHPMATTRAFNSRETRIVPATGFLGDLFQSAYQYGVLCTRPHMVSIIASTDWANA